MHDYTKKIVTTVLTLHIDVDHSVRCYCAAHGMPSWSWQSCSQSSRPRRATTVDRLRKFHDFHDHFKVENKSPWYIRWCAALWLKVLHNVSGEQFGQNALHYAASCPKLDRCRIVKLLIDTGMNLNGKDYVSSTYFWNRSSCTADDVQKRKCVCILFPSHVMSLTKFLFEWL